MAASKTVHVVPRDGTWLVQEGNATSTHTTQAGAIKAARKLVRRNAKGQFVVLSGDGQIVTHETYGLPEVKEPLRKSRLGTKNIEKAIGSLILDRIEADLLSRA